MSTSLVRSILKNALWLSLMLKSRTLATVQFLRDIGWLLSINETLKTLCRARHHFPSKLVWLGGRLQQKHRTFCVNGFRSVQIPHVKSMGGQAFKVTKFHISMYSEICVYKKAVDNRHKSRMILRQCDWC